MLRGLAGRNCSMACAAVFWRFDIRFTCVSRQSVYLNVASRNSERRNCSMKYAVIDVGSNTVRLCVYDVLCPEKRKFKTIMNRKIMAGLAAYIVDGAFSDEGIAEAILAVKKCIKRASYVGRPTALTCSRPCCVTSQTARRRSRQSSRARVARFRCSRIPMRRIWICMRHRAVRWMMAPLSILAVV